MQGFADCKGASESHRSNERGAYRWGDSESLDQTPQAKLRFNFAKLIRYRICVGKP